MGVNELALGLTIGITAWTDWRWHKIYNKLLAIALLLALVINGVEGGWPGLKMSLMGALIGFSLLLIPYFLGGMAAGDVKFLAVIGAFGGSAFVINSFLYGAVIGGIISAILLARRGALGVTLKRFIFLLTLGSRANWGEEMRDARQERFPYGLAIAAGTVLAMVIPLGG